MPGPILHHLELPATLHCVLNKCVTPQWVRNGEDQHVFTDDVQRVTCKDCLRKLGMSAAGPRCVDGDGRPVDG